MNDTTLNIQHLQDIIKQHNHQPMSNRQSWLALQDDDYLISSSVNSDLSSGIELIAEIVPVWAPCSIEELEADSFEDCRTCLAEPYYEDLDESIPENIFKADWKLIFVKHDWSNGIEETNDTLANLV